MKKKQKPTMFKIMENPKYKGNHVILVKDKIFTAKTGKKASKILEMVREKYPKQTPEVTYIPKADALILWV